MHQSSQFTDGGTALQLMYLVTKLALVKGPILQRPSATREHPLHPFTNILALCGLHIMLCDCMPDICNGLHLSMLTQETCQLNSEHIANQLYVLYTCANNYMQQAHCAAGSLCVTK